MPWTGILLSLPLGLISWIGTQTFIPVTDLRVAQFVLIYSIVLFLSSVASLIDAVVRPLVDYMVVGAILLIVALWLIAKNPWLLGTSA